MPACDVKNRSAQSGSPRVTVVIPCFNHGNYIRETVESVFSQPFADIEIIVVNDGSTDAETLNIFPQLEEMGCRVVNITNHGPAVARNAGISVGRGEYILPLDADDKISKGFVSKAVDLMDANPDLGVVHCSVCFFEGAEGIWRKPEFSLGRLLLENMIVASAMFRKEDWRAVGGYRDAMREGWEDWDFWLSIAAIPRQVSRLDDEFFFYRIRQGSRTRSLSATVKIRLFIKLVLGHKYLYLRNIFRLIASVPAWIHDGMGRRM